MAPMNDKNTIYLTAQESERIKNTVKERLKKCAEQKGNAREPRDKTACKQQATGASLMADMGGAPDPDLIETNVRGDTIPAVAAGQPYLPCSASLEDLKPMKLADLQMETHHRGMKLTVKRISPVVTLLARSWSMVQDEKEEETERLEILLHKLRYGEDILESAKLFVIKEPYFTLTDLGEATIRIDHPSDLVVFPEDAGPKEYADAAAAEKAATSYKNQGNAALKQQDLPVAHSKYTAGLKIATQDVLSESNPDLSRDIYRNRAYVNLLLEQFDEVITDANNSLLRKDEQRSKELDSKAYYRAGSAAYSLQRFSEAKQFFEEQQNLTPNDKDARIYLKKINLRLREQETGKYDIMKLQTTVSRARPGADATRFIKNTEIRQSKGKGRGLFALQNFSAGDVIMCEKAYVVAWGHQDRALTAMTYDIRDDKIRVAPLGLARAMAEKMFNNPSTIEAVMGLYGDWQGDGQIVPKGAEGPIVDVFRVHDIMSRNAFGLGGQFGEEDARNASTGLWVYASYTNHSCIPNARKENIGDFMIFRATKAIAKDEEIFHSYNLSLDFDTRQAAFMNTWGFECDCGLCEAERADGKALRDKRMELMGEADAFVEKTPWAGAKRLAIRKAQRLAQSIDETYEKERYQDLPRMHAQNILLWLSKASPR